MGEPRAAGPGPVSADFLECRQDRFGHGVSNTVDMRTSHPHPNAPMCETDINSSLFLAFVYHLLTS